MFKLLLYFFVILYSNYSYSDCSIPGWPNCTIEDANRALDRKQEQNFLRQQQRQFIEVQNQQLFELQRANQLRQQLIEQQNNKIWQIAPMPLNCLTTYNSLMREYETRCQ
jgi:hypothetical protein